MKDPAPQIDLELTQVEIKQENPAAGFKLERYKYILGQIQFLNDSLHKYLTLFQTLATAILSAGVAVFVGWQKLGVTAEVARLGIRSLMGLLIILALFVVLSILSGVFSWIDYRREEVRLLDDAVGRGFREGPNTRNFLRWYETHAIFFIVLFVAAAVTFVEAAIIPQIR